ncbi:MAG: TIGR02996 domain-containing protein [Kofleriaceae bacterium]
MATAKRATRRSPVTATPAASRKLDEAVTHALAAARQGDHAAALDRLIDAWAGAPSPELAVLISTASVLARPTMTTVRGKTASARQAWDALAATHAPAGLPTLLESLADVSSGDGAQRLATIATWRPDPRIDDAVVGLLETVPYRATSTKKFWIVLWPLVLAIRNRDLLARLDAVSAAIEANVAATMSEWLRAKLDAILPQLRERFAQPAEPFTRRNAELIADLATELGRAAGGDIRQRDLDHLLDAIYTTPEDDGPRLVYADALLERGDPRGELIALQCRRELDRHQRARQN